MESTLKFYSTFFTLSIHFCAHIQISKHPKQQKFVIQRPLQAWATHMQQIQPQFIKYNSGGTNLNQNRQMDRTSLIQQVLGHTLFCDMSPNQIQGKRKKQETMRNMTRGSLRVITVPCPGWCGRTESVGRGFQDRRSTDGFDDLEKLLLGIGKTCCSIQRENKKITYIENQVHEKTR